MASGFFALLDDIAALMDDVAVMGKVAGKKTAGLLGDDLAVNAEKASGFMSSRELPVLWAITKGSLLNKLIILPIAFLLSAFLPKAIIIILLCGGLYLAYEGAEKVYEFILPHAHHKEKINLKGLSEEEVKEREKSKIKSAILTDFILSVEIVIVALSSVGDIELLTKIIIVTIIAVLATIGVYGIVALIVRMDDFGAKLINLNEEEDSFSDKVGKLLVRALPKVIKALSVIGTIALFLVSGGIFVHNIHYLHELFENLPPMLVEFVVGIVVGAVVLFIINAIKKLIKK
ncbi:DUF808 domain-containing protein [Zunongwangia sp.]|uniref:DUF808 domain-containing protein n=1 Tax=Zunongwangia sp. TaxID=1965325 RepID=UPI003AA81049